MDSVRQPPFPLPYPTMRPRPAAAVHASPQAAYTESGLQLAPGDYPPEELLYWVLSKVPLEALQLLRGWPPDPPAAPRPPPDRLSPEHLELVARVVMEQPLGALCAVAFAGWWGSREEQGPEGEGAALLLLDGGGPWLQRVAGQAAVGAELLRRSWKCIPEELGDGLRRRPRPGRRKPDGQRQKHQQLGLRAEDRHSALCSAGRGAESAAMEAHGAGDSGSAPAPSPSPSPALAPAGDPWVGPGALPRLQLALEALAEYGWLEEPYGCTNTERRDEWQLLCNYLTRTGTRLLAAGMCENGQKELEGGATCARALAAVYVKDLEAQVRHPLRCIVVARPVELAD